MLNMALSLLADPTAHTWGSCSEELLLDMVPAFGPVL